MAMLSVPNAMRRVVGGGVESEGARALAHPVPLSCAQQYHYYNPKDKPANEGRDDTEFQVIKALADAKFFRFAEPCILGAPPSHLPALSSTPLSHHMTCY
jgi:hypothetical protein